MRTVTYRVLFLSVPRTVSGLENGSISDEDLADGLFFFDWTSESLLRSHRIVNVFKSEAVEKLSSAVAGRGVEEGRVVWRIVNGDLSYQDFYDFLSRNGYRLAYMPSPAFDSSWDPEVGKRLVEFSGLRLEVVL